VTRITLPELNRVTLARQGLLEPIRGRSADVLVRQLGSLQAQHPEWQYRPRVFSRNADVLPTFLIGGTVAGTWVLDVEPAAGRATIELRPFMPLASADRDRLVAEAERVLSLLTPGHADRSVTVAA